MIERCGNCLFFRDGEKCYRDPPPWHYTSANDWCGEFQPKDNCHGDEAEEAQAKTDGSTEALLEGLRDLMWRYGRGC